jgi:hypothetical protein
MKFGLARLVVVCLIATSILCTRSRAQTTSATVTGEVTDQSGRVVPDVAIVFTNINTGSPYVTRTNRDGIYSLPGLEPGVYRANIAKDGFKSIVKPDIELHVQDQVSINFALQVGSVSETVTVQAQGININTTDAAVSTVIDRDFVANIPLNGRSFQDLLALVPGVSLYSVGGGVGSNGEFTVNGQRPEANYFAVDGVSANVGTAPGSFGGGAGFGGGTAAETALGTTQSMISLDALQEFRATTSTYSAEYGRTPGGQFSFTSRSGTNDWHGSAFDYFRNEALDANNWFNDAATPQIPKEKERQNDFGGVLGGPIRIPHLYDGKDKTFFFFSYEGLRLWTPAGLITESVPDQTLRKEAPAALQPVLNAFPLANKGEDGLDDGLGIYQAGISNPSSIDSVSVRIDQNFSERFKVFGRYASTPSSISVYAEPGEYSGAINNRLLTLGATNLITSTQTNELRFNITQVNSISNTVSTSAGGATPFEVTTLPGPNGGNFPTVGGGLTFCLGYGGYPCLRVNNAVNSQRQYNVTDTYNWTLGRHNLKFGVDWRRLSTYATPTLVNEYITFPTEATVLANNVGLNGNGGAYASSLSPAEPVYKNFSAFVQDEWKTTARLSLSLGLRWDVNPAPGNLTGTSPYTLNQITNVETAQLAPAGTALWKTDWHGFAPRIGAAYQLRQTPGSETVLRAGFGMFYDMGNSVGSSGFEGIGFYTYNTPITNVSFPLASAQITLPQPSIAPPYNASVYAFDPNLKLPYTLEWNVAVEQGLGNKQALTVSYVGSGGRRLLESYFVLPTNPNYTNGDGLSITKNGQTSDYNALQVQFQRTFSHGLQALASYTYSHSIDDASSNFVLSVLQERASSDFDVRHNFQAALTYDIPGQYTNPVLSGLLKHWGVDARVTARTALPVDLIGNQYATDIGTLSSVTFHPNLVPGQPLYLYGSQYPGGRVINYNAFNVPASGPGFDSEGDTPRNYARGFGASQLNFAVRREFPIHERLRLQFRVEAFNLFNHPVFGFVNPHWSSGPYNPSCLCGFGVTEDTLNNSSGGLNSLYQTGGPRSLQVALKLVF